MMASGGAPLRLRYRSNSVFSENNDDVPFETHPRVVRAAWQRNRVQKAKTREGREASLHRILLWADEYWLRRMRGLLKGCGTRRENRDICSDCGAGVLGAFAGSATSAIREALS
jgi:hypothetical protein